MSPTWALSGPGSGTLEPVAGLDDVSLAPRRRERAATSRLPPLLRSLASSHGASPAASVDATNAVRRATLGHACSDRQPSWIKAFGRYLAPHLETRSRPPPTQPTPTHPRDTERQIREIHTTPALDPVGCARLSGGEAMSDKTIRAALINRASALGVER